MGVGIVDTAHIEVNAGVVLCIHLDVMQTMATAAERWRGNRGIR
jgi:hypothetical protein